MAFYLFRQNNSGGHMICDEDVDSYVIIEATNEGDADARAENVGIYFHGVGSYNEETGEYDPDGGRDCPCCGDRWYPARKGYPSLKELLISNFDDEPHYYEGYTIIHYMDGRKEKI